MRDVEAELEDALGVPPGKGKGGRGKSPTEESVGRSPRVAKGVHDRLLARRRPALILPL